MLSAPAEAMETRSLLSDKVSAGTVPVRFYRSPNRFWVPDDWRLEHQWDRAAATLAWDRETLFPRFGLLEELSSIRSVGTMIPFEYSLLWQTSMSAENELPDRQVLEALGTEYVIAPEEGGPSRSRHWPVTARDPVKNVEVRRNPEVAPRAWIAREIVALTQLPDADAHSPKRNRSVPAKSCVPTNGGETCNGSPLLSCPMASRCQRGTPIRTRPLNHRRKIGA